MAFSSCGGMAQGSKTEAQELGTHTEFVGKSCSTIAIGKPLAVVISNNNDNSWYCAECLRCVRFDLIFFFLVRRLLYIPG
jgi:hypothetical protein